MLKKMICAALILLISVFWGIPGYAAAAEGEIYCWLECGGKAVPDGSLEICRTGDPIPEGYRLREEFGGGTIAGEDVPSLDFAQWMSEKAGYGRVEVPDRKGVVCFRGLEPGMYLIRQAGESEGYYPIEPYLACVSEELLRIDTYPVVLPRNTVPRTSQDPQLYLSSLGIVLAATGLLLSLPRQTKDTEQ